MRFAIQLPDYKKLAVGAVFLLLIVLFFVFNLQQYLTLGYLQQSRDTFQALYADYTFPVIAAFFTIYIVVVAASLPGATVMTLAGGALFGFWMGLLLVSFASSIGATLACMVARYLFRDWTQAKLGTWYDKVNSGIEKEGSFYLFTMRLIPAIPFFAINLGMALTRMRLATFYWVSQVGMLPGTAVYVNAGRHLGQISRISDVLSPGLIISFVLLGIFPLAVKKIMNFVRDKTGHDKIMSGTRRETEPPADFKGNDPRVYMFSQFQDLVSFAAEIIREQAWRCVQDKGFFTLALSGGSTPARLYGLLGDPGPFRDMPWERTHVFWGDERLVPWDSEESNFGLAREQMLSRVPIPEGNIHPLVVDKDSPEECARFSEQALRDFFGIHGHPESDDDREEFLPELDLVLLGMGPDGHTASLFPGSRALAETGRLVAAVPAPQAQPRVDRVSLTLPVLNNARMVLFLVSGEGKHPVLRQILEKEPNGLPAGLIRPRGELVWLVHPPFERSGSEY